MLIQVKTSLLAKQFSYFKKTGPPRLEDFPVDFMKIKTIAKEIPRNRDLWRNSPILKKLILRSFGPIALELMKKTSLHLGCDQWIEQKEFPGPLENHFCFQGVACIFFLSIDGTLDIYNASQEAPLFEEGYLVCFCFQNAVIIDNPKDLYCGKTRNLGYVFGDRLSSEFHPLIVHK